MRNRVKLDLTTSILGFINPELVMLDESCMWLSISTAVAGETHRCDNVIGDGIAWIYATMGFQKKNKIFDQM